MNEAFGNVDAIEATLAISEQTDGSLHVLAIRGTDLLSGVASYVISVVSDPTTASKLDDALGRDAVLTIERVGDEASTHIVRGVIEEVFPEGIAVGNDQRRTHLLLTARLGELRHKTSAFVYQDMTVVEIVKALTKPWHIDLDVRLHPSPKKRELCTQVNETDLAFLGRILSEDGIHFHVEHGPDTSVLVLVNDPLGYKPIVGDAELPFRDAAGAVTREHVSVIQRERRVRAGSVAHRDYNWIVPEMEMTARSETATPNAQGTLTLRELYDYPGEFNHPDGEDVGFQPDVQWPTFRGTARTKRRLEEQRSDALTFSGKATCLRLRVGQTFKIVDHPDEPFNRTFIVTSIRIEGATKNIPILAHDRTNKFDATLDVIFTAVPSDTPVRPALLPKPPAHVRIARVVGPKMDEPYVDDYGRIKIQFAWDREGQMNEKSSCWVRMMTPSAHHNQGTYIAHRVGAEVVVDFLDGNVDRPVVIGALYNGEYRQAQKLPNDATRAVLYRGLSVPGNNGNNELSMEDRAGNEEILLHAQRDLNAHVNRNHSESIGANQSTSVGANQSVSVGAEQSVSVGKDRSVTVKGKETTKITLRRDETVDGGETVKVTKGRHHEIATADDALKVTTGNRFVEVAHLQKLVAEDFVAVVTKLVDIAGGGKLVFHHGKDSGLELTAGAALLSTTKKIEISNPSGSITFENGKVQIIATDELSLSCGSTSISLKKDGTLSASGSKEVGISCSNSSLKLEPPKATLSGAGVDVTAVGQAVIGGALIKIG